MNFFKTLQMSLPKPLLLATEYVINEAILEALRQEEIDLVRLESLIMETKRWPVSLDTAEIGFLVSARVESLLKKILLRPEDPTLLDFAGNLLNLWTPLQIDSNLWKSQNLFFSIGKEFLSKMEQRSGDGDHLAKQWLNSYQQLGRILRVRIS